MPVEQHRLSGEQLPFDAGRFDFAVSTLTLLALLVPGSPAIEEPCVAVSWPSFYDDLKALLR